MIINTFIIQYVASKVIQTKKLLDLETTNKVKENIKEYISILKTVSGKAATEFERKNKCKFEYDEVCLDSPMGKVLEFAQPNYIVDMLLPQHQGGTHQIKIISIS